MSLLRTSVNALVRTRALNKLQTTAPGQIRNIKRWVAPTLRELRKRANKLGPQEPQPRSGFLEWNYRAELFAFGKRLQEEFELPLLQSAFTQRAYIVQEELRQQELGIEATAMEIADNQKLAEKGEHLMKLYVDAFLKHSLPKVPMQGVQAFTQYLLSDEMLAHIALQLGMKELILDAEYPPSTQTLARSLKAVVGALEESSGMERAFLFVRDFVCTQLNQRDLSELWEIENPKELLEEVCKQKQLPAPEPRLIGDCGKNTVLAAYQVGIYADKKLIGSGFGEDVQTAVKTASLDALQRLFGITENMRPFNFKIDVEPKSIKLN